MTGFSNIFKAELYKLAKGKSLIKILIAIAIIFIVFSLLFNLVYELIGSYSVARDKVDVDASDVAAAKMMYEEAVKANEELKAPQKMANNSIYYLKAVYTEYKYMYENNLSFASVRGFNEETAINTNTYISFIMQIMGLVIAIYAAVSIVRSFAGERASGTLKMQLLRPISKEAIVVGKLLAVWVVSIGLFIFTFLVACVVGICAFKADPKAVLIVLNASTVIKTTGAVEIIIMFIYYITRLTQFIALGMFISNIIKKNEGASIALTLVILLIGSTIEDVLGYIFIGYAGININIDWISALTTSGPTLNYMNLYSMIGISLAWFVGMIATSIFSFKRADIHT